MTATPQQLAAIAARGNVLVAAGAGTGKTSTVTARCLDLIVRERCSVEHILMVTFTEAAAAEMRERIRQALQQAAAGARSAGLRPGDNPSPATAAPGPETCAAADVDWLDEQLALLDTAPISTLHSFCLELVRRNFHVLGLDPQFTVLDEQQTKPLIHAVLTELFEQHYAATDEASRAVAELIRTYGNGRDEDIRRLIVQLHQHAQTLADPEGWLAEQIARFSNPSADASRALFVEAVRDWAQHWRAAVDHFAGHSANVAACATALRSLPGQPTFPDAQAVVSQVGAADAMEWARGTKTRARKPIEGFFTAANFLAELARTDGQPLAEDWEWSHRPMLALLELAREFGAAFARAKRELGGLDFADQEQFALRLLRHHGQPTAIAQACRSRFHFVFVDECQDINAAQDAILDAISRDGAAANRFLVGDVKQSIYRFRLAQPRIFQEYQERWSRGEPVAAPPASGTREQQFDFFAVPAATPPPAPALSARALSLTENFRSREALLQFINPLFRVLMRPGIGGLTYDGAELEFGNRAGRAALTQAARREVPSDVDPTRWPTETEVAPRVALHVLTKDHDSEAEEDADGNPPDLQTIEREARLVARQLRELRDRGHRVWRPRENAFAPVEYADMVVLLRGVADRAEVFARAFHREGVPLHAARAGFLQAQEVADVLNLLRLLDNPLQDLPLLAVLRAPFVGLTPEELVELRRAAPSDLLWIALQKITQPAPQPTELRSRLTTFRDQLLRWRERLRHASLTQCIETALLETHYEALVLAGERGPERLANVRRLIELARRFDPYQREGLFRFLQFIAEQEEVEVRHEPAELFHENAVRLMTIHASKGLEFPVVVLAGLGTRFNVRELANDILLHEDLGLCPKVLPPDSRIKYPSLAHWLAAQRERRALLGEELRLLYVAMTRARDTLLLTGAAPRRDEIARWHEPAALDDQALVTAGCCLDWLRLWFTNAVNPRDWSDDSSGATELLRWRFHHRNDPIFAPQSPMASAPANLPPLAPEHLAAIRARLAFQYPHLAATRETAKSSVTLLRRRAAVVDEEARPLFRFQRPRLATPPEATEQLSAIEVGLAHHAFLQFVDLAQTGSEPALRNEAARLSAAGQLTEEQSAVLDFAALAGFWSSPVGQQLRTVPPDAINREMPFTARFATRELEQLVGHSFAGSSDPQDFVVVQGEVDLAVLLPRETWLLDFKTDHVTATTLPAKVKEYTPQLQLYALALARIYGKPVTHCWLHFLTARSSIAVDARTHATDFVGR